MASILKRGKTYTVIYDRGADESGKRKQAWEGGYTYREALKRKAEIEYAKSKTNGTNKQLRHMTAMEFYELWLPVYRVNWQFSTYRMATDIMNHHVLPYLGEMILTSITPLDIERVLSYIRLKPNLKKNMGQPLSATTVHHTYSYMRLMFNKAVEWGFIDESPVKCKPPKRSSYTPQIWTADMVRSTLDSITDHPMLRLAIHLAFVCSLRIGELLAIRITDIDFDDESITINKTLQRMESETIHALPNHTLYTIFDSQREDSQSCLIIKETKTPSSHRKVYLTQPLIAELKERIRRIESESDYHNWDHNGLLFCVPESGAPVEPKLCQKWFSKWQDRNYVHTRITFHQLRHASTTYKLVIGQGDIKSVQADNGHANIKMTLDHYAGTAEENRRTLTNRIGQHFYSIGK